MTADEYIEQQRQRYAALLDAISDGAPDLLPLIVEQWFQTWRSAHAYETQELSRAV